MYDNKMFNKLTMYLETCESGSMFEDMSIPGVYALSASNPTESSWGSYCGSEAQVNGKSINSCLGDLFSVNWMEEADASDMTTESLDENFNIVKTKTDRSQVMQWGDESFTSDKMSEFIGNLDLMGASASEDPSKSAVNARQVDLARLYSMYVEATTSADRLKIGQELQQELNAQLAVDMIHSKFLNLVYPGDEAKQEAMRTDRVKPALRDCEVRVHNAFMNYGAQHFDANSGFALQFHQVVVNVCADQAQSNGPISNLEGAVKDACAEGIVV
jgi:legumain